MARRFVGDPGEGKMLLGWNIEGSLKDHLADEILRVEEYANGVSCTPKIWREFSNVGSDVFGSTGDGRLAASKGMRLLITWEMGTPANGQKYLNGDYDFWINKMIYYIRELGELYGVKIWWDHSNEPCNPSEAWNDSSSARKILRETHIYTYNKFKAAGLTNVMMTSPTFIPMTFHNSQSKKDNRQDWWAEYFPTYKGSTDTRSAFEINKDDFLDIPCLMATNQYCWHGMDGALVYKPENGSWTWDEEEYRSHQLTNTQSSNKHMWHCLQATKALGTYIVIGEWGWPVHESKDNSHPRITANHWSKTLIPEMLANRVVGACLWKQVRDGTEADIKSSAQASGGRYSQFAVTGDKGQVDDKDCRRKALAACFEELAV